MLGIFAGILYAQHLHATADTTQQGIGLILAEIAPKATVQNRTDGHELLCEFRTLVFRIKLFRDVVCIAIIFEQRRRHIFGWQNIVDKSACRRALRHAHFGVMVEPGLAERQSAQFLDRRNADRAIAAITCQNDTDCVRPLVLCERNQERIDRRPPRGRRFGLGDTKNAVFDFQDGIGRYHRNRIRRSNGAVDCHRDGHAR